jgi:hypothetical protein
MTESDSDSQDRQNLLRFNDTCKNWNSLYPHFAQVTFTTVLLSVQDQILTDASQLPSYKQPQIKHTKI